MRRRIRKKKRVGEFQELGFEVTAELRDGLSEADFGAFLDRWISAIEARRLTFGGGGGEGRFGGFVVRAGRGSATDDDRASLSALLQSDAVVVGHEVGELRDAWYGWD